MRKIIPALVVLSLMLASFTAGMQYQRGDVNQDGNVSITDVTCLIDYLMSGIWPEDTIPGDTIPYDTIPHDTIPVDTIPVDTVPPVPQNKTFTVNGVSFTMIAVQGGTFTMGATPEQGKDAEEKEKPAHDVTLSDYYISETLVTQELWEAVMEGENPSYFHDPKRPVERVSWNDCQTFIARLSLMVGQLFSMPTEAQWEYAARGGIYSLGYKYAGSNTVGDVAWYTVNAFDGLQSSNPNYGPHVVATKMPNELGIYDMSGNVHEWCHDWSSSTYYSESPAENPKGPSSGIKRIVRGGCYFSSDRACRVSSRSDAAPSTTGSNVGFRIAL